MPLTQSRKEELFQKLEEAIGEYDLLEHPFYQLWQEGKLEKDSLAEYSKEYYGHVRLFPRYISAVHANCPDIKVRQVLLENLREEDEGKDNHPALWIRFANSLGVSSEEVEEADLLESTKESVDTFVKLTRDEPYLNGVAALYAYESQVPQVAKTKREGLAQFYGIDDEEAVSFFTVHEEADIIHRQMEKDIIMDKCQSEEDFEEATEAARRGAKALWHFLDGVYESHVQQ